MKIKQIRLKNIVIPNNIFMAPLAGYTCYPFRILCQELGAGLTFTEMASANGLRHHDHVATNIIFTDEREKIKAVQLLGGEPDIMGMAACSERLKDFDMIDINMGCPVPNVFKNGEGSALLGDMKRAYHIIHQCKKSGKIISVKFRIGIKENEPITAEFAKMCEDAGADVITIHGRSRSMMYNGTPYYEQIHQAKSVVQIPVIANGGIFSKQDADFMMEQTDADGVMIGRYGLENPFIFCELLGNTQIQKTKLDILKEQIQLVRELCDKNIYTETFALSYMKKLCGYFMKKEKGTKQYKQKMFQCGSMNDIEHIIDMAFSEIL